jgi:hypothetical protein
MPDIRQVKHNNKFTCFISGINPGKQKTNERGITNNELLFNANGER